MLGVTCRGAQTTPRAAAAPHAPSAAQHEMPLHFAG
eukprot:CAMPEP_0181170954 /NCGR_PEP_ID=MMETSP1096-20121128/1644_1 /TAXON_ID=156174 ORGANISM="Chrysochromulina ericina, Strain CCMP281" /NCGR_SAMPLE_ID=MMETSP1096 /ASSEMBLY_ACC=CAM_ASM_000453 /LENGTH=35 /DNA_ID= /DNA_START= /DNA_END= /DNA_ORIENTATION=